MVYILFTNRNVTNNLDFLKPIKSNSDLINVNGSVYKFKREVLDIITDSYDRKSFLPELLENALFIDFLLQPMEYLSTKYSYTPNKQI